MNHFSRAFDIVPERININIIMNHIYQTFGNFKTYDKDFLHHKTEENFRAVLERQVPQQKSQIERIYDDGRDNSITLNAIFNDIKFDHRYTDLKSFVDYLEPELNFFRNDSEKIANFVEETIANLEFYKWSIDHMIKIHRKMIDDIDQILRQLLILKSTNTYRYLAGEITMKDIDDQIRAQQINISGSFQQSQLQFGTHSTMHINQINNQALQQVCNQMREIIDQSNELPEVKQDIKNIVAEIEATNNPSAFKDAYTKLTSALSNHITIFTAFASSRILTELTKYLG